MTLFSAAELRVPRNGLYLRKTACEGVLSVEIVICGVPRSGNVLLRNIVIEIQNKYGENYYEGKLFEELDQRVFLFVRRFLAKKGIISEHIAGGGYEFQDGCAYLRSKHRMSDEDFLFLKAPLGENPSDWIISTHSLPGDVPRISKMLCTMRNLPDVIDSTLNIVYSDMQVYSERGEVTSKNLFLMRWGSLEIFDLIIQLIAAHYTSLLQNQKSFFMVRYEQLVDSPVKIIRKIAERLDMPIDPRTADDIWNKLGNRGLMGKWRCHYRSDRKNYFRIRDFLTAEHLRIMGKHNINELIVESGYDERLCYSRNDIAVSDSCKLTVDVPEHFRMLETIEESIAKSEIALGQGTMRYCGPRLEQKTMHSLSAAVTEYLDGKRSDLSGKSVVLYGGGRLGRYVDERIPETATRLGYIENDDFSLLQKERFDTVVICSIGHEAAMQEKLIGQGVAPERILTWYEVV